MKRLFEVNGQYFESKSEAKVARGDKIPNKEGGGFHYTHAVSKGPDHMGNHGIRVPSCKHRAPQGYHEPKPKSDLNA
jgi:hypothetical protein